MPLILGSIPSFIITLTYIPIIHKRMTNEEKILAESLEGYKEYMQKVKYRIIPFIY
jgi:protein-S-isoprenylcysteine O-methyltransferase Ste14